MFIPLFFGRMEIFENPTYPFNFAGHLFIGALYFLNPIYNDGFLGARLVQLNGGALRQNSFPDPIFQLTGRQFRNDGFF